MKIKVAYDSPFGVFDVTVNVTRYIKASRNTDYNGLKIAPDEPEMIEYDVLKISLNGVEITQQNLKDVFTDNFELTDEFCQLVIDTYKDANVWSETKLGNLLSGNPNKKLRFMFDDSEPEESDCYPKSRVDEMQVDINQMRTELNSMHEEMDELVDLVKKNGDTCGISNDS